MTCCTTSSTSIVHLHLTIRHHIQTQTTAVSLLQLITGKWHDVTNNISLSVSLIITYRQVWPVDSIAAVYWQQLAQKCLEISLTCICDTQNIHMTFLYLKLLVIKLNFIHIGEILVLLAFSSKMTELQLKNPIPALDPRRLPHAGARFTIYLAIYRLRLS